MAAETSASAALDLPEGRYVLLCFLPDPASSTSHLHQGMVYPFTVA